MMFPLVRTLADDGIPVTVAYRVFGFSTQGLYTWKEAQLRSVIGMTRINAAYDIHADDPALGYRFIADELPSRGSSPFHGDLMPRKFTAQGPNKL